jgi:hypothetical protein
MFFAKDKILETLTKLCVDFCNASALTNGIFFHAQVLLKADFY